MSSLTLDEAVAFIALPPSPYAATRERIDGVDFAVFAHGPRTLRTLYAMAERHAERVFLVYEDEQLTFAQAQARAASLGHALVHEYGVQKGDRVALAMRNYPEWCTAYQAVTAIGAVIVPLNAWWTQEELRFSLEDCGARVVICDSERLERVAPLVSDLSLRIIVARPSEPLGDAVDIESLLETGKPLPEVEVHADDDATLLYTSGSTGRPKGVLSSNRAVAASVFAWELLGVARGIAEMPEPIPELLRAWVRRGEESLNKPPFDIPQRSILITLPLFHVTGCNVQFLPSFRGGRKMVMMRKWSPERALELIEREKVTDFSGVPTMSWELVNSPDFAKRDTSSLMSLSAGGAARPPSQVSQLKAKAQHAQPSAGYGMTETNSLGTTISGEPYLARPASIGRPLHPLVELKIVDRDRKPVGPGIEGEICIKSVTNMRGYWNRPDATRDALVDGYIITGDLGRIDEEGYLYITGRAKDIVIRGGENISCAEVENVLYEHPAVFEAAVYGVPDERLGEVLVATVRVREGHTPSDQELKAHVARKLAAFKVPSTIFLQYEELPRGATDKINKLAIKKEAEVVIRRTSKPPAA